MTSASVPRCGEIDITPVCVCDRTNRALTGAICAPRDFIRGAEVKAGFEPVQTLAGRVELFSGPHLLGRLTVVTGHRLSSLPIDGSSHSSCVLTLVRSDLAPSIRNIKRTMTTDSNDQTRLRKELVESTRITENTTHTTAAKAMFGCQHNLVGRKSGSG